MDTAVKCNTNSVFNCQYHVMFCPKYRRKVLVNGIDERLKVLIRERVEHWQQRGIEGEVMPDPVHMLVTCDPLFGIHRFVKYVKSATAHQLRLEYPELKKCLPSEST